MAKAVLRRDCLDAELVNELEYRNTLATMLRTFIIPWRDYASADGRLHTTWHQVRGQEKNGTRTGRIASAEPNLANMPNVSALMPPWGLPFLPALRAALLPEEGHVWMKADYSQQELRLTAHFEDGEMMRAYQNNPSLDLHALASELIKRNIGMDVPRKRTKTVAFAAIYGAGLAQLASQLDCSQEEAAAIRMAYFKILPGLQKLINKVKAQSQSRGYITSLGGRIIPLERPKIIDGRLRDFTYKQINRLVQGSAADQTKEAIACLCESGWSPAFRAQCYDEINLSVPEERTEEAAQALTHYMTTSLPTDVPMLVDVEVGSNHASVKPWAGVAS
jgi:DNA polymerase-1